MDTFRECCLCPALATQDLSKGELLQRNRDAWKYQCRIYCQVSLLQLLHGLVEAVFWLSLFIHVYCYPPQGYPSILSKSNTALPHYPAHIKVVVLPSQVRKQTLYSSCKGI